MLSCKEVLARYSDYRDGLMPEAESAELRAHVADCPRCRRYDHVVRRGVDLLAQQRDVQPDPEFMQSLQYRLAYEDERRVIRPVTVAASASVSIAAMLALAAWVPVMLASHTSVVSDTVEGALSNPRSAEIAWHTRTAVAESPRREPGDEPDASLRTTNVADVSLIDRGYSPLIIDPPTAPPSYMRPTFATYESR